VSSESESKQLTNSYIVSEKNKLDKIKNHKSSFGDYEAYANESEREF
jgi:hypothetical protein